MVRRVFFGLAAALGVFAISFGFAASLGGLSTDGLGADDSVVAACDTDGVSTSYSLSFDDTDGRYEVSAVSVSGIADACDGQTLEVTLANSSGAAIGTGSATIPSDAATSHSISLSTPASAELVVGVHVTIS